ncbi:hypothetical protein [Kineosporia sp. NBRC 101731]|uniref:hypothetical protein n=1 Tax=Kineosporia sp. NBRC 101731 TaxID=3032199 RepID=UPI00255460FB|nr:hypothetical protein [Kineosporia sp. NBRC 101731]
MLDGAVASPDDAVPVSAACTPAVAVGEVIGFGQDLEGRSSEASSTETAAGVGSGTVRCTGMVVDSGMAEMSGVATAGDQASFAVVFAVVVPGPVDEAVLDRLTTVPDEAERWATVPAEADLFATVAGLDNRFATVPTEADLFATVPAEADLLATVPAEAGVAVDDFTDGRPVLASFVAGPVASVLRGAGRAASVFLATVVTAERDEAVFPAVLLAVRLAAPVALPPPVFIAERDEEGFPAVAWVA